jgi:hypothetical protein
MARLLLSIFFITAVTHHATSQTRRDLQLSTQFDAAIKHLYRNRTNPLDPFEEIFLTADHTCVKEKMQLEQNKQKILTEPEFTSIIALAFEVCIGDRRTLWDVQADALLAETKRHYDDEGFFIKVPAEISDDNLYCLKMNLAKINANAKILDGFVVRDGIDCGSNTETFSTFVDKVEKLAQSQDGIEKMTCGLVGGNDLKELDMTIKITHSKFFLYRSTHCYHRLFSYFKSPINQ